MEGWIATRRAPGKRAMRGRALAWDRTGRPAPFSTREIAWGSRRRNNPPRLFTQYTIDDHLLGARKVKCSQQGNIGAHIQRHVLFRTIKIPKSNISNNEHPKLTAAIISQCSAAFQCVMFSVGGQHRSTTKTLTNWERKNLYKSTYYTQGFVSWSMPPHYSST